MNVSDAVRTKRAVRKFTAQQLPQEVLLAILNAGRHAQSAKNAQAWRFLVVTDKAMLGKLSQLGPWAGHLSGAAAAICILTPDPDSRFSVLFDAGQAAAYMQLAAWELGVGSVPATLYDHEKARKLLCIPADWHVRVALSFGYPADEEELTRPPRRGGRLSLGQVVHWGTWESSICDE